MKIIPYHKLAKPAHEGYRGWDGGNPNFDVVSELDRDVFIVYVAWGDGELLKHDMENCRKLGRTIFHVTGDWAYVPKEPDSCFYFVTNLNPMSPCYQMQVPYSYHQSLGWLKAGNKANKGERKWLASFQGSMNTNQDRRRLTGIACDDIFINELDGWQEAQAGRAEEALRSHSDLMQDSVFTFCPTGHGPSSIRAVEAMFRGSLPVLLGDETRYFSQNTPGLRAHGSWIDNLPSLVNTLRKVATDEGQLKALREYMAFYVSDWLLMDQKAGFDTQIGHTELVRREVERHG